MAGALPAVTLPSVVAELLSEMAAAVREGARSTGRGAGVAASWAVCLGRGREARASPAGRYPRPGRHVLFSLVVLSPNLLVARKRKEKKR